MTEHPEYDAGPTARLRDIKARLSAVEGNTSQGAMLHFQSYAAGDIRYLIDDNEKLRAELERLERSLEKWAE